MRLPELLAPAGDWDCARAAVENGADAIYFGLTRFNARLRASNFSEADLPNLMRWLHRRGVKGYVTFNTLVFTRELPEAAQFLRCLIAAGVDAAIVQDVGVCRLIRSLSPDFPIHASTQMTVTSASGVAFARKLGCEVVVLARENSIPEIERLRSELPQDVAQTPLEIFVHGALCVAYSGQCLTSEALGGRSANRGECAQACRLPYELISDGHKVDLGDRRYLLSPQDLAGLEVLPALVRAGIASLKIEGRLKSPEYVASITRIYREALDRLAQGASPSCRTVARHSNAETPCANPQTPRLLASSSPYDDSEMRPLAQPTAPLPLKPVSTTEAPRHRETSQSDKKSAPRRLGGETLPDSRFQLADEESSKLPTNASAARYEMEMAFSRGLSTGWLGGIDNQRLVHGRFGKKRGVLIGQVLRVDPDRVWLQPIAPIGAGDGVVFDAGRPDQDEEGGRVFETHSRGRETALTFLRGAIRFDRIQPGDRIWKTSDPKLEKRLQQSFASEVPRFQRPLDFELRGSAGTPLSVKARDTDGHEAQVESSIPLEAATRQALDATRCEDQFGRLGGTAYRLGSMHLHLDGPVHLPLSELNRIRREIVRLIDEKRSQPRPWQLHPEATIAFDFSRSSEAANPAGTTPELVLLVRSMPQLDAALSLQPATLYCEFENPKHYRDAVAHVRRQTGPQPAVFLAPPRIFKPGEEWILNQVRSAEADGILVRNHEHLSAFADVRRIGDFSLNVANPLTAEYFIREFGLERITASYDLNAEQLEDLVRAAPPEWFEITLHQHMPMFHMEHCVFCAFLSSGKDYRDCGRPCDRHDVRLRDRVGAQHPLRADAGCRNTVFNARAQTGADHAARLLAAGVRRFRLEFLDESPEDLVRLVDRYRRLLRGELTGEALWREFKLINQLGVTRGQLGKATGADLGVDRWTDSRAYAAAW